MEVVFLDIQMPGLDGLAVAATLMEGPEPPVIVFATAFDERRLAQTIASVRQALAERATLEERQAALRQYLEGATPVGGLTKLWGQREKGNWALVDYQDVLWVVAEAKKVYMHTATGEKLQLRHILKDTEPRLVTRDFARVHKGYLVNLNHVTEVVPWFSGTYLIRMNDAARTRIPSRTGTLPDSRNAPGGDNTRAESGVS